MALDTKYRPLKYGDVMGQEATADVLRQFIRAGMGFHQSYLFCGAHGSGKTTLGRILARALLCASPVDGEPCDACMSCTSILERGSSECFAEMDAATKSGKENITRITEELDYSTLSGKQRIYLFDEAHRLSKQALDALLKPMEDVVQGEQGKQLVCIFCTTEPEKMRTTVFSRCAPAFTIRTVPPDKIAERLTYVCDQEGLEYEPDALQTIAEVTECHIRDALKMIEGISMLGSVTGANLNRYLRLDVNETLLRMLGYLGNDVGKAMSLADEVCQAISPSTAYERLSTAAMLAYKVHLGAAKAPAYWKPEYVKSLGNHHGDFLVIFANAFASRPGHPTPSMLAMDLARMHQARTASAPVAAPATTAPAAPPSPAASAPSGATTGAEVPPNGTSTAAEETPPPPTGKVNTTPPAPTEMSRMLAYETSGGVYVDPRAVRRSTKGEPPKSANNPRAISPDVFREALADRVAELRSDAKFGPAGRHKLGGD